MGMKVFGPPKFTNVARTLICLEEVGAEYEIVPIDYTTGKSKTPVHLARNPFGQVPAFQDDEFTIFVRGEAIDQQAVDTSVEKLKEILEVYEARLSQCKYLAGDFISFADLTHFSSTYYLMKTNLGSVFDSYPHVKAWWEAIMARPSIKKVVEIMSAN